MGKPAVVGKTTTFQNNKLDKQILRILHLSLQVKFPTIPTASTINSTPVRGKKIYSPY